jgi:hypothetical protein
MKRAVVALAILVALAGSAGAQSIRHIYRTAPSLVGLGGLAANGAYQNAADLILENAIRNLPLFPQAGSAYTYRWNEERNELERVDDSVSPFFLTERAQTLGERLFNVGVTFGRYDVGCASGCKLGTDPAPVSVCCGSKIRYQAPTDLDYTVSTFNFTYGLLEDLDINIAVPIVTLDMDLDVSRQDTPHSAVQHATLAAHSANLSDMLVRLKYRLFQSTGDYGSSVGAAGLRVRIPTGNPNEGLGTGFGEIGPYFAFQMSVLNGWLDSYWDGGVDAGIGNTRWSSAHYSWALDIHAPRGDEWWTKVALAWSVLGRSEFTNLRAASSVSGPHVTPAGIVSQPYLCVDPSRHDYADTTLGLRIELYQSLVLSVGVFKSLNDQGVRATGWSPVGSFEATF